MKVRHIGAQEFETEVKQAQERVLVDFYAEWCGPCQMMSELLDEIAEEEKIPVFKINIDRDADLAAEYKVMTVPTLILFQGGEAVKRTAGVMGKKALENWIE